METVRTEQRTIENLRDAGCDEETIQDFILAIKQGDEVMKQSILEKHRAGLVHTLNAVKKNIDCLDYLAYQLKKEMNGWVYFKDVKDANITATPIGYFADASDIEKLVVAAHDENEDDSWGVEVYFRLTKN